MPAPQLRTGRERLWLPHYQTRAVFFLVLLVGIIFRHCTLESGLFAISLAVGLTPEFLR